LSHIKMDEGRLSYLITSFTSARQCDLDDGRRRVQETSSYSIIR